MFEYQQQDNKVNLVAKDLSRLGIINGFLDFIFKVSLSTRNFKNSDIKQIDKIKKTAVKGIPLAERESVLDLVTNLLTKTRLIFLLNDLPLKVPNKTLLDINRNIFYINNYNNKLLLNRENYQIFFQLLYNNYFHEASKMNFMKFMANYTNQDGFLFMLETQLKFMFINKYDKLLDIRDKYFEINFNYTEQEQLRQKAKKVKPITLTECFKVTGYANSENNDEPIIAEVKLISSILGLGSSMPYLVAEQIVISAEKHSSAFRLAEILEDSYRNKELNDIFGFPLAKTVIFSVCQEENQTAAALPLPPSASIASYFAKLRI